MILYFYMPYTFIPWRLIVHINNLAFPNFNGKTGSCIKHGICGGNWKTVLFCVLIECGADLIYKGQQFRHELLVMEFWNMKYCYNCVTAKKITTIAKCTQRVIELNGCYKLKACCNKSLFVHSEPTWRAAERARGFIVL